MRKLYFLLFTLFSFFGALENSFGQVIVTIGSGTSTARYPIGYWYGHERSAAIYNSTEIGNTAAAYQVNSVAYNCDASNFTGPTVIYVKAVGTTTTQTASTWANKITGATQVYAGTPNVGPSGWRTIEFTTPFLLAAGQNLEVLIETNFTGGGNGGPSLQNQVRYSTLSAGHQFWQQDGTPPTGNGTVNSNRPNVQLDLTPNTPCVPGSLLGGTTSSSVNPVCSGVNFTLTADGSIGTGLTYQWQSSPDGVSWTDIGGATSRNLTRTQTASTYYRRKIACGAAEAFSTALQVTLNSTINCYCSANLTTNVNGIDIITDVTLTNAAGATYSNPSASNGTTNYDQINNTPLDLARGTTPSVAITFGSDGAQHSAAWVDFNQNGVFESSENVALSASSAGSGAVVTYNFLVPITATLGNTRIRVRGGSDDPYSASGACDNMDYGETEDYLVNIVAAPPCVSPSALLVSGLTTTTATISWTAATPAPAGGYEWEIRTSGAGGSGATGLAASGSTAAGVLTANVTGLVANTTYTLYVRSACTAGSIYSTWASSTAFTTPCNATGLPYNQDFESAVVPALPTCTSIQTLSGNPWTVVNNPGSGFTSKTLRYAFNSAQDANSWFFTQAINLTGGTAYRITYRYGNNSTFFEENLKVAYGTASNAAAMTLTLATHPGIVSGAPITNSVDFIAPSTGVYYFGFQSYSFADQWNLYLDDINIKVKPTCEAPTEVYAIGITGSSAQAYFTSPGNDFIVEYGAPGFVPGTGAAAGAGTIVTGTSSPITITGLVPSTNYDFYVRRVCAPGLDYSENIKATATTLCVPTNVPYTQDFNGTTPPALPLCTSLQDLNGTPTWNSFTPPAAWGFQGNALLYLYDPAKAANDWFFTQGLNLTGGVTYQLSYLYGATDPLYPEKLKVAYGVTANASGMINPITDHDNIIANAAAPFTQLDRVTFTPSATGVYYIGFNAYSDADQFRLILDSINVKVLPKVDVGVTTLVNPPTCPANNNVLKATLHNFNLNPIDFSVYPITITADITGSATTTLSTIVNTGTLAAGADLNVDLPAYTLPAGVYTITTASSSADDGEAGNNSYSLFLVVNPTPAVATITPAAPQICVGGNTQLSTQFTTPPPAPVVHPAVSSGTISVAVPDNSATGASHTLSVSGVPATAAITGISVTINATHTFNSDLIFNLKGPNGKVLNLVNRKGGGGEDFVNAIISSAGTSPVPTGTASPVTGTFSADGALGVGPTAYPSNVSNFTGLYTVANGDWTLSARDAFVGDVGTITSWSITITYGTPHPAVTWSPIGNLFTNAGLTTPYAANLNAFTVYANPVATTTYTVTTTSAFGCTATKDVTVTVNPNPVINIAALPTKICTSDTLVALTATPTGGTWSGIGVSGNNLVPPATAVGTYTLAYTYVNNFGCKSVSTVAAKVEDCPERIRLLRDDALILFPNPNNGQFNVRVNSTLYNKLTMRVYTSSGLLARTQQFSGLAYGRVIPVDLTNMPGGSYIVHFYYDGGVRYSDKSFKVIVGR